MFLAEIWRSLAPTFETCAQRVANIRAHSQSRPEHPQKSSRASGGTRAAIKPALLPFLTTSVLLLPPITPNDARRVSGRTPLLASVTLFAAYIHFDPPPSARPTRTAPPPALHLDPWWPIP